MLPNPFSPLLQKYGLQPPYPPRIQNRRKSVTLAL
jgi:hypothetical protein